MPESAARIVQINVSDGGVPKRSIPEASVEPGVGITTDRQADTKHHGGPLQDLCLFRYETIRQLRDEGHPIYPGAIGENLTIEGLALADFTGGTILEIGETVRIELTEAATPCSTIADAFLDGRFVRVSEKQAPDDVRMYARVLTSGIIRPGDTIRTSTTTL